MPPPRDRARDFAAVYDEQIWHVYGFFAYRLRDRSAVEDLTQLTFERALRAWGRYDPARATVRTWLMAIAGNLLVDHFRADRSARNERLDDIEAGPRALEGTPPLPDLGLDPDLDRALGGLSDRERELIALRFGADLTGPEIADHLQLSLSNVQQILSRALRRMRAELEPSDLAESKRRGSAAAQGPSGPAPATLAAPAASNSAPAAA